MNYYRGWFLADAHIGNIMYIIQALWVIRDNLVGHIIFHWKVFDTGSGYNSYITNVGLNNDCLINYFVIDMAQRRINT